MDKPMTDEELNIAVAEKVMGRKIIALDWPCRRNLEDGEMDALELAYPDGTPRPWEISGFCGYEIRCAVYLEYPADPWPPVSSSDGDCYVNLVPVEDFANDWRPFGDVVEAMAKRGWTSLRFHATWDGGIMTTWAKPFLSGDEEVLADERTHLRAACMAAIKAVESEVDHG